MTTSLPVKEGAKLRLMTEVVAVGGEYRCLKQLLWGMEESTDKGKQLAGSVEGLVEVPDLEFTVTRICEICGLLQQHSGSMLGSGAAKGYN